MSVPEQNVEKPATGQKPYDPGWNDPPMLSYIAQIPSASKAKISLSKRVAFPLNSSPSSSNPSANPLLPPITNNLPPLPSNPPFLPNTTNLPIFTPFPVTDTSLSSNVNQENNSVFSDALVNDDVIPDVDEIVRIFNGILEESPELGNKLDDIRKRISVMQNMWAEGKFVDEIKIKMLKLAKALQNADTKSADELHKSLMVSHISTVGTWMVAIKQLIMHCSVKNELLQIDKES